MLPVLLCLAACLLSMSVRRCRRRSTQERGPFSCLCDVFRPTSPDKHARNLASSEYDKEQQAAAVALVSHPTDELAFKPELPERTTGNLTLRLDSHPTLRHPRLHAKMDGKRVTSDAVNLLFDYLEASLALSQQSVALWDLRACPLPGPTHFAECVRRGLELRPQLSAQIRLLVVLLPASLPMRLVVVTSLRLMVPKVPTLVTYDEARALHCMSRLRKERAC